MDRFDLAKWLKSHEPVEKAGFIEDLCRGKWVLDLGCIRHSARVAMRDKNWLHGRISKVAEKVIGIDYVPEEVEKVRKMGYDIRCCDVTEPVTLEYKFDVIVAGDLIEHLVNVRGFFQNCKRLLKRDGRLVITTPNPFYLDEFCFVALKGQYMMNPEHTCWLDPYALHILMERCGFRIIDARFICNLWAFSDIATDGPGHKYDILKDEWVGETKMQEIMRHVTRKILWPLSSLSMVGSQLIRYADYLAVGVALEL